MGTILAAGHGPFKVSWPDGYDAALKSSSPIGQSTDPSHALRLRQLIAQLPDDKLALTMQLVVAAVTDMDYLGDVAAQVGRTGAELLAFMQTDLHPLRQTAEQSRGWYDPERIAALKAARVTRSST